jgi:two-component system, chemotaxis family, chemotaxis protein CheY
MKNKSDFPSLNTKQPEGFKPGGQPYKMMIVEDKDFQRKQLAQIFESEGYDVITTANDGKDALAKYEHHKDVDFITTNLDMPILDGYALAYELNQKPDKPLVIFISDDTTKGVMEDLVAMGIGDFILKPINRRIILERVKKALQRAGI